MAEPTKLETGASRATSRRGLFASFGAVSTAFLASVCCIGPVLFVTVGIGAGLASMFEPVRPLFTVLTVAFLAVAFYVVYGRRPSTGAADTTSALPESCVVPRVRTRDKVVLWLTTVVALVLLTFPQWSLLLL